MNTLDKIALLLLIVGGFNWGLVGWVNYNLVDGIFGVDSMISRVIYALVGAASLYSIYTLVKMLQTPTNKLNSFVK
jgi:uncharacterized membrane protein YuzA (DUF378 family)